MANDIKVNDRSLKKWAMSGLAEDALKIASALHDNGNGFSQEARDDVLRMACTEGRKFLARVLLTAGANANARDEHGNTPLLLCAERGHVDIAKILGDNGADANCANLCGETPLTLSISPARSREMICYLINGAKTNIDLKTREGEQAMRRAVEIIDVDTIMLILEKNFYLLNGSCCVNGVKEVELGESLKVIVKSFGLEKLIEVLMPHSHYEEPPMVKAARLGSYELVSLLCAYGHEINMKRYQDNALVASCKLGRLDLIQLLISYQAEVNVMSYNNEFEYAGSPLDEAISGGHIECIKLLLRHGAYLHLQSAMVASIKGQQLQSLEFLMDKFPEEGAALACSTDLGLLHYAAKKNNESIVILLLDHGCYVDSIYNNRTPLMNAVNPRVVAALIERGASVNFRNVDCGVRTTPLLNCLDSSYEAPFKKLSKKHGDKGLFTLLEIVKMILKHGGELEEDLLYGCSPIMVAARNEWAFSIVELLVQEGANINRRMATNGETALHIAADAGHIENVKVLISNGADVNVQCKKGYSPLMTIIYRNIKKCNSMSSLKTANLLKVLRYLVENGANLDLEDNKGNTAVGMAIKNLTALNILLEAGANPNHQNKKGFSPLMKAAKSGNYNAIDLLCQSGADVNALHPKMKGKTVLSFILSTDSYFSGKQQCITTLKKYEAKEEKQ